MARVLGKEGISSPVAKVVELSNEYVINGHVYDKNTMSPIPLAFLPMYTSSVNESLFYRTLYLDGHTRGRNFSEQNFAIDINDPTITYVFFGHQYADNDMYKVKKNTTGYEVVARSNHNVDNDEVWTVLGQDNDHIYVVTNAYSSGYGYARIKAVRKSDMNIAWQTAFGHGQASMIKMTDSNIYMTYEKVSNNVDFIRVNKMTGAFTTLYTETTTGWNNYGIPTKLDENNCIYLIRDEYSYMPSETKEHRLTIKKYHFDFSTGAVTPSDLTIDFSTMSSNPSEQKIPMFEDTYGAYELYMHKDNDDKYLTMVIFDYGNDNNLVDTTYSGMYTFKMNTPDDLELIDHRLFDPIVYTGVMPLYNATKFVMANENVVHFYSWNSISKRFEKTSNKSVGCVLIGADMGNNLWLQYKTGEIELLANSLPLKIETDFVEDNYKYNGEDIATNVYVKAENYLGKRLATNIELQLVGDVIFTENGMNTITKTTSETGDLVVPVTIKGAGILRVSVRVQ